MNETDAKTMREVLAAFGITPDRIEPNTGNTTSSWRVDAGASSFVVRRRALGDGLRIRSTHDLLRYLAARFRHAPAPQPTVTGEDWIQRPDGLYELLTYLPGDVAVTGWDFDWDDDAFLQSAAHLLAELNLVMRDYEPPANALWYQVERVLPADEVAAFLAADKAPEAKSILGNLPLVYKYLEAFPKDATPRHVIHNDFAWYNVVRREREAVGVIDFDSAHVNSELHDLAYAVYAFAPINQSVKGQTRSIDRTARRVALFLTRYEQEIDGPLDISSADVFDAAAYRVALSGATLVTGYVQGEERSKRLLSHAVGYAEWLGWYENVRVQLVDAGERVFSEGRAVKGQPVRSASANSSPIAPARCWLDPRVDVRPSAIRGLGLFASAPIPKGEVVGVLGGRTIDDQELRRIARTREKYNSLGIAEGVNLLLQDDERIARGNHSCDSNLWMRDAFTLEARRDIATGEEITVDYALQTALLDWEMACRCGSPLCRKVIRGSDWMRPELQERYRGHFSPFLNERIEKLKLQGQAGANRG